ncbi:MAG: FecR domain-containing protein [Burkholderiales bacterium]|nr:FecR domain-containing protein [Burkholderiales bacterium]
MNSPASKLPLPPETGDAPPRVTPDIAAEAALWVARLHGPDRSPAMEREFRSWQARSAAHREAFGRCTETWQDVALIGLATAYDTVASVRASHAARGLRNKTWRWSAAFGLAIAVAGGGMLLQHWREQDVYRTAIGEQRLIVLDDGTRMLLNTDTRVRVAYGSAQRTVEVRGGEALFEVAKEARRPFVVHVAGSEVVAVGTVFSVRFTDGPQDRDALAVTLIEGQVNVRAAAGRGADGLAPDQTTLLRPGDRLQLHHAAPIQSLAGAASLDRPNVDQVMAWRRREAVFQDSALVDAVEEMNRYSRTPVVLTGGIRDAGLRVSGLFRTGDSAGFARAVAALHGLSLLERNGRLELANVR